eukprot:scaffold134236_cov78-Phaeocystis_antarctica.AAC.1
MEVAAAPVAFRRGLPGGSRASAARAAGMAPLAGVAMATAAVTAPVHDHRDGRREREGEERTRAAQQQPVRAQWAEAGAREEEAPEGRLGGGRGPEAAAQQLHQVAHPHGGGARKVGALGVAVDAQYGEQGAHRRDGEVQRAVAVVAQEEAVQPQVAAKQPECRGRPPLRRLEGSDLVAVAAVEVQLAAAEQQKVGQPQQPAEGR